MNYDITFCSKKDCNNLNCKRNQKQLEELATLPSRISIQNFEKCKYWKEKNNATIKN